MTISAATLDRPAAVASCPDDAASSGRICYPPVPSFRHDGTLFDMAAPTRAAIDFAEVAARLARIARFNGAAQGGGRGLAISVAQHSVMGAQALIGEGKGALTAALFLLHDAHEYVLGDETRPNRRLVVETLDELAPGSGPLYLSAIERIRTLWDGAIYAAAGLPPPNLWNTRTFRLIKDMDDRMMAAEAEALFGPAARRTLSLSDFPRPAACAGIEPWGAMKAELRFAAMLDELVCCRAPGRTAAARAAL